MSSLQISALDILLWITATIQGITEKLKNDGVSFLSIGQPVKTDCILLHSNNLGMLKKKGSKFSLNQNGIEVARRFMPRHILRI